MTTAFIGCPGYTLHNGKKLHLSLCARLSQRHKRPHIDRLYPASEDGIWQRESGGWRRYIFDPDPGDRYIMLREYVGYLDGSRRLYLDYLVESVDTPKQFGAGLHGRIWIGVQYGQYGDLRIATLVIGDCRQGIRRYNAERTQSLVF